MAHWYSSESTQQELSNEYQHDKGSMVFKCLSVLVLWKKVASALEGLNQISNTFAMQCSIHINAIHINT